jgi:hypothetical protein
LINFFKGNQFSKLLALPRFREQFSNYLLKKLIPNNSIQVFEFGNEIVENPNFDFVSYLQLEPQNSNLIEFKLKINKELEEMDQHFKKMRRVQQTDISFHFEGETVNTTVNPIGSFKLNNTMKENSLTLLQVGDNPDKMKIIIEGSIMRNDSNFIYHLRFTNKFETEIQSIMFRFKPTSIFGKSSIPPSNVSIPVNGIYECYLPLVLDLNVHFNRNFSSAIKIIPQSIVFYFDYYIEPELFFNGQMPSTFYSNQK